MNFAKGSRIFVDTNAIAAACSIGQWNNLCQTFEIETVKKCVEEALRPNRKGEILVGLSEQQLTRGITVHAVDSRMRYELLQRGVPDLDDGERDLLAYALNEREAWWLCGPDKATMNALHVIGRLDRAVSLEKLLVAYSKKSPPLEPNQTERWLSRLRTELLLGG